jgi:hypothetical protein
MKTVRLWVWILGLVVLGASSACVVTPTNGDAPLCGADAAIEINGYAPDQRTSGPGWEKVRVEVGPTRQGPFTALTVVPMQFLDGETWGAWNTGKIVVPRRFWGASGDTAELFVRARYAVDAPNGNNVYFFTYDNSSLGTGQTVACVGDRIHAGASRTDAVISCASSQSPLVRVTAPVTSRCECSSLPTFQGDAMIRSAADIDAHRCDVAITGTLSVLADAPDVVSLPRLTQVGGRLGLDLSIMGNASKLRRVQLPALSKVDGLISIVGRPPVDERVTIDVGLPALATANGPVNLEFFGPGAVELVGLSSLTRIDKGLDLRFEGEATGDLFLPKLDDIGGRLLISHSGGILNFLRALTTVGGPVILAYHGTSPQSERIGFDELRNVGGDLSFFGSPWESFDPGEPAFGRLGSVGGTLRFENTTFKSVALGTPPLALTSLAVVGNPQLVSLPVAADLPLSSTGTLTVQNNLSLPECEVMQFASDQAALGFGGEVSVGGNAECLPGTPRDPTE